jgi:para-nitrobenzyl esterase
MTNKSWSLILFILCSIQSIAQPPSDTVSLQQGLLSGVLSSDHQIRIYKGIPFAAPPTGNLRWKEPQPPEHWLGIKAADHFGNSAMQITAPRNPWTAEYINEQPISEDCLYLNIWAPQINTKVQTRPSHAQKSPRTGNSSLAVLVFIHGGGYTEGAGYTRITDGENLAKSGIIVISINYRLGIFGFFTHPELTKESDHHASGNYGLMDQIAALKWIQDNITAFGGDPHRVTISGQSAGAGCVHDLIASPLAKGLFSGGIAESGSDLVPRTTMLTLQQTEKACSDFVATMGLHTLEELRALPADQLLSFAKKLPGILRPVIDGWILPESVPAIYREGKQNDVPILTGINADEGSSKSNYGHLSAEEFKKQSQKTYGALFDDFERLYPSSSDTGGAKTQIESARDNGLASLALWAEAHQERSHAQTFIYYFTHPIPWPQFPQYGAFHAAELPYVFNNLDRMDRPWQTADKDLASTISSYWVNFIKSGNPNGPGLPVWLPVNLKGRQIMCMDINPAMRPVISNEKWLFFKSFFKEQPSE